MKPLKDCVVGDIIEAKDGSKAKVLARLFSLIFRSDWYQYEVAHYRPVTVAEGDKEGWRVLLDGKYPMKKKEVESLMNITIVDELNF